MRARPFALRPAAATCRGSTVPAANGSPSIRGSSRRSRPRCAARDETRRAVRPDDPSGTRGRRLRPLLRAAHRPSAPWHSTGGTLARPSTSTRARAGLASSGAPPSTSVGSARASPQRAHSPRCAPPGPRSPEHSSISAATSLSGATPPEGGPWRVDIADPRGAGTSLGTLELAGGGVATSGRDTRRFGPGRRFHHLIDPATGMPAAAGPLAVTVEAAERNGGGGIRNRARSRRASTMPATCSPLAPTSRHWSIPQFGEPVAIGPLPLARDRPASCRHQHAGRTVPMALKAHSHPPRGETRRRSHHRGAHRCSP